MYNTYQRVKKDRRNPEREISKRSFYFLFIYSPHFLLNFIVWRILKEREFKKSYVILYPIRIHMYSEYSTSQLGTVFNPSSATVSLAPTCIYYLLMQIDIVDIVYTSRWLRFYRNKIRKYKSIDDLSTFYSSLSTDF